MRYALIVFLLASCTQFPQLDATLPAENAIAPRVVPLGPILAQADRLGGQTTDFDAINADLQTRLSQLRSRAANLQGPVIPTATRNRMRRGIDTSALQ
ncbi:hypothetical protein [Aestuariibius sp. HNIBRBA575]|uniref:hypothetical protein n=1 Tax=Aestuariibius sp. HNIBRBA575 TaxID=3233343 RepID=UPI0034A21082